MKPGPTRTRRAGWALTFLLVTAAPVLAASAVAPAQAGIGEATACRERIQAARRAFSLSPDDPRLELGLARALARCREYSEAIARYQRVAEGRPGDTAVRVELGDVLRRAGRASAAVAVLREALAASPESLSAQLALAQALAAADDQAEALERFNRVLAAEPQNYDALQGKAYVLLHTGRLDEARAIFANLSRVNPADIENEEALTGIGRAEAAVALLPIPSASEPPERRAEAYRRRLSSQPGDRASLMGLAQAEAQLKDFAAASDACRKLLAIDPSNRDAQELLARLLAWNHRYADSIQAYRDLLKQHPDDGEALEGLARVETWSHHPAEALAVYRELLAREPTDWQAQLAAARLETQLGQYAPARLALNSLLAAGDNEGARLALGELDLRQGQFAASSEQFGRVLERDPANAEARVGEARALYYQNRLSAASAALGPLLRAQPQNFDALILAALIARARRHRREAFANLATADRLSPANPEARALRDKLIEESPVTLHLGALYARELGRAASGEPADLADEDLRVFSYTSRLDFTALPRTDSSVILNALPSESPSGILGGAVTPQEFLYQQTTRVVPLLTLRGGLGVARFGSGQPVPLPGAPGPVPGVTGLDPGATVTPIGFFGGTFVPGRSTSLDLTWSRAAVPYTPLSTRLGVVERRVEGGVNFLFDPRTELHLAYYRNRYQSKPFAHTGTVISPATGQLVVETAAEFIKGSGGTALLSRQVLRSRRLSIDAGYSGLISQSDGPRRGVFLGVFTPGFYQRHLLTTRLEGPIAGPLRYDFSGGVGLQQVERRQALRRALRLNPSLIVKVSPRASLTLGYLYYDSAQTLGVVSGNGVQVGIDWKL